MSGVAGRIAALSPEQRALFEKLRQQQQRAARRLDPPPIARVSGATGQGDWPLSLDQERFWFMEQLYSNHAGLNITAATRLRGRLAVPLLGKALAAVVRRHAAWRTTFPATAAGAPLQRVAPPAGRGAAGAGGGEVRLAMIDLSALPAAVHAAQVSRLVDQDTAAPFDLARGPLVRAHLLRLSAVDHVCVLTVHHLVTDWISFQIAWSELAAAYQALAAGRPAALPEPPVHYPDFAVWQRAWLSGEVLAELESWWRQTLAGVPLVLDLPLDRPRPAVARMRGGRRPVAASPELSEALRALGRRHGATLFMTVLAATGVLIHRDSGQERLVLGANNANRNRPEIEPVLGCFLTQVPFVIDLTGDPAWSELLTRVRQSALGSFGHQDLPFGKLVEAVRPERDASRQPVIQTLVQVLDAQYSKVEMAGVSFEAVDSYDGRARYDLMLSLYDAPGGIAGSLEYDADLFDAATVERMVERFLLQAAAAAADPGLRLSQLPVLSAAARHQALHEWNDTEWPAPPWTVPGRIAAQALATPDAAAVVAQEGGLVLSYGELARRAGGLAGGLRAAGVGTESRVALALQRGADIPLAILAVWLAGGAYVPLDPDSPRERLARLLADAAPRLVVHRGPLPVELPAGLAGFDLAGWEPGAAAPGEAPPAAMTLLAAASPAAGVASAVGEAGEAGGPRADQLAYLLYTSGTTGLPKAAMIEHGGLAAMLAALGERLDLRAGDRVPAMAPYVFDASLLEMFLPLLVGGVVEVLSADQVLDLDRLLAAMARATQVLTVPAQMRRLPPDLAERQPGRFAGLRALSVGGDVVTPDLQARLLATFPAAALHVMYGPTEISILCTGFHVPRWRPAERSLIGWPLPGVEALVVDRRLAGGPDAPVEQEAAAVSGPPAANPAPAAPPAPFALVAPGVPGELWIGGRGVGRGYFGRDQLTAQKFVVAGGRRFYRTGDLVRQVHAWGGALEFLARTDQQVKVRGVRVEPGEVEAALRAHPSVADAVVAARPAADGENLLVAYWVAAAPVAPGAASAPDLLTHLRQTLPAALVPAVLVPLAELPRNAAGKVDRQRLPVPPSFAAGGAAGAAGGDGAVARGAVEELVAGIWCQVLGVASVPAAADFFALGGHSLLATQVISRLRAATGVELPVREMFQSPTVEALARAVTAALAAGGAGNAGAMPPAIGRAARDGELPLSFAQERLWFLDRLAPGSAAYHIPVALRAQGALSLPAMAAALDAMTQRHEALRTTFGASRGAGGGAVAAGGAAALRGGPRPVQVVNAPVAAAPLPVIDLAALPPAEREAEARRLVDAEVARPFDLERDAVLRQSALRLGAADHVLLLVVHHIAADGWSIGVMVREITALYAAAVAARPAALPPLPVQYADFAVWQRQWLRGEALERQLAYWRRRLAAAPALDLPTDRPRPAAQSFRGATRMHAVPAATAAALRETARRGDATLFMLLLAAFQTLLGRYAGRDDVVVGTPIANRTRAEIEPLIGFFVNTLVLRGDLAGDPPFGELLARTRRAALEAYSHQDLPFERLVEELRPERRLAHNPLFQVMFAVQNTPLGAVELPGVAFAPVELTFPATRFDLELFFTEVDGALAVQLTYSTDLFDRATMLRLLGHLDRLLAALPAAAPQRLSQLALLAPEERQQLAREWNDTAAQLPAAGVAARFAHQARRRPDAVALSWEDGEITYAELARRAAAVAAALRNAGIGAEARVALAAQRGPALVAGILGILAVGGAYVPLDPSYPTERLAFMLDDSQAQAVLGDPELTEGLPAGLPRLDLTAAFAGGGQPQAAFAPRGVDLDGLAYVMYTSGSTGRPKGVGVTHRGILRLVAGGGWREPHPGSDGAVDVANGAHAADAADFANAAGRAECADDRMPGAFVELGPGQVFLQLAPVSFDASTLELWAPLLHGGRLAIFPPRRPALADLAQAVARWGVSSLWLTAGLFHQMVDHELASLAGLTQLLAGGDVLSPAHVRRALAALPAITLVNGYGPTESTTFACCHRMPGGSQVAAGSVPLGRPIGNTRLLLLGRYGEELPAGAWGELWIGGDGLARGYVGRPDLTAASFAPDPVGGVPGARLYRTGDVARWRADGTIEFRGRRDGQVKVRGYRVELGEIESALRRHPRVEQAAVVALRHQAPAAAAAAAAVPQPPDGQPAVDGGELRLVAYVVPAPVAPAAVGAPDPATAGAAGGVGAAAAASAGAAGSVAASAVAGVGAEGAGDSGADAASGAGAGIVEQWRELYEQTYARGLPAEAGGDAAFNVQGWNSSYTGEPIPAAEMREWLDGISGRLLALPHRRVLEVGCGTGLLLFRVAPRAESYRGTDFSAVALAQVAAEVQRRGIAGVQLEQRQASDWSGVAPGSVDLVVLNSVVQYFPSADYLVAALAGAAAAVAPGGAIFVGDVRSLPLLQAFHTSVELHAAAGTVSAAELARRVRRGIAGEQELCVDPDLFRQLAARLPAATAVQVQLHRGRHANELTRFRYDVILRVGAAVPPAPPPALPRLDWRAEKLTLGELERRLRLRLAPGESARDGAPVLTVCGVPNARLAAEAVALELMADPGTVATASAADLRAEVARRLAVLAADPATAPVDPEDLWALGDRLGCQAEVGWPADGGAGGTLEVRFRSTAPAAAHAAPMADTPAAAAAPAEPLRWGAFTNDPLAIVEQRRLAGELRRHLDATLPEYMVPAAFVVLDALPLTANGKVDQAALPPPDAPGQQAERWVAPATPLERLLAEVTVELLGIERAGLRDNFFALGGHSLLATQLVSRLTQEHGLAVTLRMVFDAADLGDLADRIVEQELAGADDELLQAALGELDGLGADDLELAALGDAAEAER